MICCVNHFSFSHLNINNIYNHRPFVIQECSSSFISTFGNVWTGTNKSNEIFSTKDLRDIFNVINGLVP